jgi:hypothetical protein
MPPDLEVETELVPAGQGLSQLRSQYRGALLALIVLVTLVLQWRAYAAPSAVA